MDRPRVARLGKLRSRSTRARPLNVGPLGVEIQMPMLFDIVVTATDFLGHQQQYEMTVIAADDRELRDEINAFFSLRDVVDTWRIVKTIDSRPLLEHDAHAIAYRERGPHSYIS